MTLVWRYTDCHKTEEQAFGEKQQEYLIIRTTSKFWLSEGDTDPVGRKGTKRALKALAQLLENARCEERS